MIGVIVTGHGNFASGMLSAVHLLAGETDFLQAVDFLPHESEDDLKAHLEDALDAVSGSSHVYVLCDLIGGSPFKMLYSLCRNREDVDILYGVNLPMVLDISMRAMAEMDSAGMIERDSEELLASGHEHMGKAK